MCVTTSNRLSDGSFASDHTGVIATFVWDTTTIDQSVKQSNAQSWKPKASSRHAAPTASPPSRPVRLRSPSWLISNMSAHETYVHALAFDGDETTFFW
jgi:hypothetical protein